MKSHKKGDFSFVNVILGIIFILIMIKAAPFMYTLLFSKSDVETCRASVSVKSISIEIGSLGTRLSDPLQLNLDCQTNFLAVKKGGVYEGDRKVQDFGESDPRFNGKNLDFKLKTAVADRMWDCWYMFGNGERDPFSKLGGDIHCVECYEIQFDNDVKKEATQLDGFSEFLTQNYRNEKAETTYAKYIYKSDVSNLPAASLSTSEQYGIVYFRSTGKFADDAGKALLGGSVVGSCVTGVYVGGLAGSVIPGAGTVAGGFLGGGVGCLGGLVMGIKASGAVTGDVNMGVAVIPVEKMAGSCRKLY